MTSRSKLTGFQRGLYVGGDPTMEFLLGVTLCIGRRLHGVATLATGVEGASGPVSVNVAARFEIEVTGVFLNFRDALIGAGIDVDARMRAVGHKNACPSWFHGFNLSFLHHAFGTRSIRRNGSAAL